MDLEPVRNLSSLTLKDMLRKVKSIQNFNIISILINQNPLNQPCR